MEAIHSEKIKDLTLEIYPDQDARNPREDSEELGTMQCWHKRYDLGDKNDHKTDRDFLRTLASIVSTSFQKLFEANEYNEDLWLPIAFAFVQKKYAILPLYLYDHSGITMRTTSFSCRCDSGQVGWIYASLEDCRKEWGKPKANWSTKLKGGKTLREMALERMVSEVEVYDDYLTGNVYGYAIKDADDNELDSCWGFLGDQKYCLEEARAVIKGIQEDIEEKKKAAVAAEAAEKLERDYWESRDVVTC